MCFVVQEVVCLSLETAFSQDTYATQLFKKSVFTKCNCCSSLLRDRTIFPTKQKWEYFLFGHEKIYANFSSNFIKMFHLNLLSGYWLFVYLSVMRLISCLSTYSWYFDMALNLKFDVRNVHLHHHLSAFSVLMMM